MTSVVPGSIDHQLQNCVSTIVYPSFGHQCLGAIGKHTPDIQTPIVFDARHQFWKTIQPCLSSQSHGLVSYDLWNIEHQIDRSGLARKQPSNCSPPTTKLDHPTALSRPGIDRMAREHASITPFLLARSAARPPTTLHMSREKRHGTTIAHESTTHKLRKPAITPTLLSRSRTYRRSVRGLSGQRSERSMRPGPARSGAGVEIHSCDRRAQRLGQGHVVTGLKW
jgi:hypothetical protein